MVALKLVANISKLSFVSFLFFCISILIPSFSWKANSQPYWPHILPSHGSNQLELRDSSLFRQDTALLFPKSLIISARPLYHLGSLRTDKQNGAFFPALSLQAPSNVTWRPGSNSLSSRAHIIPMLHKSFQEKGISEPWVRVWSPGF